jgi:hypothetical protein
VLVGGADLSCNILSQVFGYICYDDLGPLTSQELGSGLPNACMQS